jgi:RNA polymerase sigma-70 factor, ECF subfamily
MHVDDQRVIEEYLHGDREAVALVERWLALAAGPFRRRLGIEWEDAVQEARLAAYRELSARRFRGEARLKTYLARVACLTCIDALRRMRRRPRTENHAAAAEVASTAPSPLELALRQDARRSLHLLLASTSPACRELWRLIQQGLGYRDMAARLEVAEGTLRVRVHRCRQQAVEALRGGSSAAPAADREERRRADGLP